MQRQQQNGGGGGGGGQRKQRQGGGEEKRQDSDGGWYSKQQFVSFYGGYEEWECAKQASGGGKDSRKGRRKKQEEEWQGGADGAAMPFVPTGGFQGREEEGPLHGTEFEKHFWVPRRLQDKSAELISSVNDWHYPMLNDHPRNNFFRDAMKKVITPESCVLEIGAGSGLLSLIAASLGAKQVVAIEANYQLCQLARQIIKVNGLQGKVTVLHKMSTDVTPGQLKSHFGCLPDVLVSELLGTLLLSESAVHYVHDALKRLCKAGCAIIPQTGRQFVTLAESADFRSVTAVSGWGGMDLSIFNSLQDTCSLVFSKVHGVRFSSLNHRWLSDAVIAIDIDFRTAKPGLHLWPRTKRIPFRATATGTAHVVVASWEVTSDGADPMSTHPDATRDNLPRDMQWGQGIQIIEDGEGVRPKPLEVKEGEWYDLVMHCSTDGVCLQFIVERRKGPPKDAGGGTSPRRAAAAPVGMVDPLQAEPAAAAAAAACAPAAAGSVEVS